MWLDQLDIQPGQRWARAVQDALNSSARFIVILSPSSASSTNVEDEVTFALEEHKTVIPVFYRDCNVPFQLRPFQHVDFRTDYARGLHVMLKTLGVEQPAAAEQARPEEVPNLTAERARLEQPERKPPAAADKARLEQKEGERIGEEPGSALRAGVRLRFLSAFPAWIKIGFAVCGVLIVALALYWAARSRQEVKTELSNPPTSVQSPSVQESVAEAGTNLFNGTWIRPDGDRLTIDIDADNLIHVSEGMPADRAPFYYHAKLDGTPAEYHGNKEAMNVEGTNISVTRKGNVLKATFYRNAEVVGRQTATLAADGESLLIEGEVKGTPMRPFTFMKEHVKQQKSP